MHPLPDANAAPAASGHGSVGRDHTARFALTHGYTLEQVEIYSTVERGTETHLQRLLREAEAVALDYRIVQWTAPTPPEYVDGYAWMKSRMSTDVPSAALEVDEETWDATRVAAHDARYLDAGSLLQVTAGEHIPSGTLCAYNELHVGTDRRGVTHQVDTLVLKEHRGHRLGLLVKCSGLLSWFERVPPSPRVDTYNAFENRAMLDVNDRIGFREALTVGTWQKVLE